MLNTRVNSDLSVSNNRLNIRSILFLVIYCAYYISYIFRTTQFFQLDAMFDTPLVRMIILICGLVLVFWNNRIFSWPRLMVMGLITFLIMYSIFHQTHVGNYAGQVDDNFNFAMLFIFMVQSDLEIDYAIKLSVIFSIFTTAAVILTTYLQHKSFYQIHHHYPLVINGIPKIVNGYQPVNRNTLGFLYPNTAGVYIFFATLGILYLTRNKSWHLKLSIVLFALDCVVYFLTVDRTALLINVLFFSLFWLLKVFPAKKQLFFISSLILFLVGLGSWIYLTSHYNPQASLEAKINHITSNRLYMSNYYHTKYHYGWLGKKINFRLESHNIINYIAVVDSFYVRVLLEYGILMLALLVGVFISKMKKFYAADPILFSFIIAIAFYGFSERTMFNVVTCPLVLIFAKSNFGTVKN